MFDENDENGENARGRRSVWWEWWECAGSSYSYHDDPPHIQITGWMWGAGWVHQREPDSRSKKRRPVNRKCRRTNEPIWLPYCRPPTSAISAIKQSLPGQSLRRRGTFGFWPHCQIGIFGTRRIIAIALNQIDDLAAYLCLSKTLRWIVGGKLGRAIVAWWGQKSQGSVLPFTRWHQDIFDIKKHSLSVFKRQREWRCQSGSAHCI